MDEYFIDAMPNADTLAALNSEKLKYGRVLGKIHNKKHIMVAGANIVAYHKPFADGDLPAFEVLCTKIAWLCRHIF